MNKLEVISFIAVFILGFVAFAVMDRDKVIVDNKHEVICIEDPYGKLLGCMDKKGVQVEDEHVHHGVK